MSEGRRQDALVIVGILLLGSGLWLLLLRMGLVPPALFDVWARAREAKDAFALILVGAAIVLVARSRDGVRLPGKGVRLYRSRTDRWLAGVLGGLARYLDADPAFVRLAYLGFGLIDAGKALIVYLVLALLVPEEPRAEGHPSGATSESPIPPAAPGDAGGSD